MDWKGCTIVSYAVMIPCLETARVSIYLGKAKHNMSENIGA
jgi:hypothetical protein